MSVELKWLENGTITSPKGYLAGATYSGIRTYTEDKLDLGIVYSEVPCAVAGTFTKNRIKSPSVVLDQQRVSSGRAQAIVVNSGIANTSVGEQGMTDAIEMAALAAKHLDLEPELVLPSSTGLVGVELPMALIRSGVVKIQLSADGGHALAQAIRTTDTRSKKVAVSFQVADVCNLPDELASGKFDFAHTGGGSLVWIPDIEVWAKNVSSALRAGGKLLLLEEHPIAGCLWVQDGVLIIENDYFSRKKPIVNSGWSHFEGGENAQETKYEFCWPLGDVITALVSSGLRIDHLSEYPSTARFRFGDKLDEVKPLPGGYFLTATKAK